MSKWAFSTFAIAAAKNVHHDAVVRAIFAEPALPTTGWRSFDHGPEELLPVAVGGVVDELPAEPQIMRDIPVLRFVAARRQQAPQLIEGVFWSPGRLDWKSRQQLRQTAVALLCDPGRHRRDDLELMI